MNDWVNKSYRHSKEGEIIPIFIILMAGWITALAMTHTKYLAHCKYLGGFLLSKFVMLIETECLNVKHLSLRNNYCIAYWHITMKRLTGYVIK